MSDVMDNTEEFWQVKKRRDEALRAIRRRFMEVGDERLSKAVGNFLNLKSDGYILTISQGDPKFIENVIDKKIASMDCRFRWTHYGKGNWWQQA